MMLHPTHAFIMISAFVLFFVIILYVLHKVGLSNELPKFKTPYYSPLPHDPKCDSKRGGPRSANRKTCQCYYDYGKLPPEKRQYYKPHQHLHKGGV